MALIGIHRKWPQAELIYSVKNWTQNTSGTNVRMANDHLPLQSLGNAVNHVLGKNPRVLFQKAWNTTTGTSSSLAPLCRWIYNDTCDNATSYQVRLLYFSRTSGSGDSNVSQWTGATEYSASNATSLDMVDNNVFTSPVEWRNLKEAKFTVNRGAKNSAVIDDGLTTNNNIRVIAIVVQDLQLNNLDTTKHLYCSSGLAKKCGLATDTLPTQIAQGIHSAFTGNPNAMLMNWCGHGVTSTTHGNAVRVCSDAVNYVNVFDDTMVGTGGANPQIGGMRTVNSVGACWNGYQWGRAPNKNTSVKIHVRVLARSTGTDPSTVWFQGPNHVANNYNSITIPAASSIAWFGTGYVWNNGNVAWNDTTLGRNKIDVFFRVSDAADRLYVYGVRAWAELI